MEENNFENVNEIDLECKYIDDDDDLVINDNSTESSDSEEDRPLQSKTGIIINLSDDEEIGKSRNMKVISANIENGDLRIKKNFKSSSDEYIDPNAIDMECSIGEDDDFLINPEDEEINFSNKELVDEDMLSEKKATTQGEVEKDYWKNIQKKHLKSNKKGAYNTHFHLAGNPKMEMDMFNHDMKPASNITPTETAVSGNISGTASASGGEGCCESLNENYRRGLNDVFLIIGFDVFKNSDGSYTVLDTCDETNDLSCNNKDELLRNLQPYIDDCFILPLRIQTGQNFNTCQEFCDWYTPEIEQKYPQCKNDIRYCDLLAHHWNDCDF